MTYADEILVLNVEDRWHSVFDVTLASNVECICYIVLDIIVVLNKHKIYELKALKIYHSDRYADFHIL